MPNDGLERRRYIRVSSFMPIEYRVLDESNGKPLTPWLQGMTENLSIGGVKIKTYCDEKQIEQITSSYISVLLKFTLLGTKFQVEACGNIVYFRQFDDEGGKKHLVNIGVSFTQIALESKNRIASFIKEKFLEGYGSI